MKHRIELGHQETDIDVVFPNGHVIQVQYRLEGPSIDICLPEQCRVCNWDEDMGPAPMSGRQTRDHVRDAQQLVIDIDPAWVE